MHYTSAEVLGTFSGRSKEIRRKIQAISTPNLSRENERQEIDPHREIKIFFPSKGIDRFESPFDVLFPEPPTSRILLDGYRIHDGSQRNQRAQSEFSIDDPIQSITLTWTDINVQVGDQGDRSKFKRYIDQCCNPKGSAKYRRMGNGQIRILKNVTGIAMPGRLLAIMGASGSGKTTLLNVLTHRNLGRMHVDGQVRINGQEVGSKIRTIAAYVQQDDLFIGTLRVREHLNFQASLRLDKNLSKADRNRRIDEVISELGLGKCQHTIIGGTKSRRGGISGGERKRLAFASEVLTKPPILFCDEPTSGLDSFMAVQTIDVLKKMALKGRTIVCTIHQPSSQVFQLFDDLCLLAEGRMAYLGPAKDARQFFDNQGYQCPANFNPADHYIRILASMPGKERQHKERLKKICNAYDKSEQKENIKRSTDDAMQNIEGKNTQNLVTKTSKYKASWCQQYKALLWRSWVGNLREPLLVPVRLMQTIVISIILGLVFYQIKLEGSTGVQNVTGLIFLFITNMTFQYAFAVVNVFCEELPVFLREHFSGVYRVDAYFLAKIISELPQYVFFPFLFTVILYFMAGLEPNAAVFFTLCGINILTANVAISLGYMISCLFVDLSIAMLISPTIIIPFMLFAGYYINLDSVPVYFVWLQYISYFKYSFEAAAINQLRHVENIPGCGKNDTCPTNGLGILQSLSIDPNRFGLDIGILAIMMIVIRLIAFFALLIRTYARKA